MHGDLLDGGLVSVQSAAAILWGLAGSIAIGHWWLGFTVGSAVVVVGIYAIALLLAVLYDEWRHPSSSYTWPRVR